MSRTVKGDVPVLKSFGPAEMLSTSRTTSDSRDIVEMRPENDKMVRGMFRNLQTPGSEMSFNFRGYKGQPIKYYTLKDGCEYEIPLSVKKHLNSQVNERPNTRLQDARGNPIIGEGDRIPRCEFRSLD